MNCNKEKQRNVIGIFKRGDSLSITIAFDEDYNIDNLVVFYIYANGIKLEPNRILETDDTHIFRIEFKSSETTKFKFLDLDIAVNDSQSGVIQKELGTIKFINLTGFSNESVNHGSNITINLLIPDDEIIEDIRLINIYKGEDGSGSPASNVINIKHYNAVLPITKENYEYIVIDGDVHSGTINFPTAPVNGENYTVEYISGSNTLVLNFAPKSFIADGFNQYPLTGQLSQVFVIVFDSEANIWRLPYSSNN